MLLSSWRHQDNRRSNAVRGALIALLLSLTSLAVACTGARNADNANGASDRNATAPDRGSARSQAESSPPFSPDIKEPDRYTVAMTIGAEGGATPALQFSFSKFDTDRRWTFMLGPPLGQVAYLEKSGLKYVIFFERKQYIEVQPGALGVQVGAVFTPNAVAERLKSRVRYEKL